MSTLSIADHIPDIDLITTYAERQTGWFSQISPWTRLLGLGLVVILITVTASIPVLVALYALIMLIYRQCGLPVRRLVAWYAMPVLFVISLIGILIWTEPGVPILTIPLIIITPVLTDAGLLLLFTLLLKALITFSYSILFLMTTRYQHLAAMIYQICPAPLDQIFLMAYRFLFLTLSMTAALIKAVRSRGGGLMRSVSTQGRLFAAIAGLTFIRSFEQAERVSQAMNARGYQSGTYGARTSIPYPSPGEYLFLMLATLVVALIALAPTLLIGGLP